MRPRKSRRAYVRAGIALGVVALSAFPIGACSSSSPGAASSDAGLTDVPPDSHDTYPAPHPPFPEMLNFGGRVLTSPRIVTVTFAGADATLRDTLRKFGDAVTSTPWWSTVMSGYGVGAGAGGGYAELPDTLSGKETTDAELQSLIATSIASGALPQPTDQTIYVLYAPYNAIINTDATSQSCNAFAGYHFSAPLITGGDGGKQRFLYSIVADCVGSTGTAQEILDNLTYTASHEIAEVATDPDVNSDAPAAWLVAPNDAWVSSGRENGDMCLGQSWHEGSWFLTKAWNREAASASRAPCQPSRTSWYFAAAPWTENPSKLDGATATAPNSDGYVTVKAGTSRDVEVDVFSSEKLPSDLTVLAGRFPPLSNTSTTPYDPYKLYAPYPGITFALSQATARNGDRVTMTITVDASLSNLKKRYYVRAVLSATDYHTWPMILYVP